MVAILDSTVAKFDTMVAILDS